MFKNIILWVARCFSAHPVTGLELRPVLVSQGKAAACDYGQHNAYGLYEKDAQGLHLKGYFESYRVAQQQAHVCALHLAVTVFDHIEVEETQRALHRAI